MPGPNQPSRRWSAKLLDPLPVALVAALLAPVALLFTEAQRLSEVEHQLTAQERGGVEYLRALAPLTQALVNAQSAAVSRQPVARDALTRAIEGVAATDAQVGDELRTHDRWITLRAKVESLRDGGLTDPQAAFDSYNEVTDLLMALHQRVGETSGLSRDPRSATYFLQHSVVDELPGAIVASGRLVDLVLLSRDRPDEDFVATINELAELRHEALEPAHHLVGDLRSAVNSSEQADLGVKVLGPLDVYERAVEELARISEPTSPLRKFRADPQQLANARLNVHLAGQQLQPVILAELDALLQQRLTDSANASRRRVATATVTVALLLLLVVAVIRNIRRATGGRDGSGGVPASRLDDQSVVRPAAVGVGSQGS